MKDKWRVADLIRQAGNSEGAPLIQKNQKVSAPKPPVTLTEIHSVSGKIPKPADSKFKSGACNHLDLQLERLLSALL